MIETHDSKFDFPGYIQAMKSTNVLVAGDIMLDRFVYGEVSRISPESPVPVLSVIREDEMPGGAGNVVSNLSGLGVNSYLLAVCGHDSEGQKIQRLAKGLSADISGLVTVKDRPTTVKSRFLASNQQLLRTDFESRNEISSATEEKLLKKAGKIMPKMQALVLSDYGKGVLTESLISSLIDMAHRHNVPVLVDPKKDDYAVYKGADIVTPNRKELSEATGGMPVSTDDEVISASQKLIIDCGIDSVVATRSQDGMSIISKGTEPLHLKAAEALEVFDVSGAGDTVIAVIAATIAAGASLPEAAMLANIAGNIVVTKVGTAPIRSRDLMEQLNECEPGIGNSGNLIANRAREARICRDWDEAREEIQRWRARGLKVGFTNGCFDILHAGHANYLNRARDKCDRLIIGLNSDGSVKRLKGDGRPVNDEMSRATVLAALGAVDMVVFFGETGREGDEPSVVLDRLRPDIFFKGGDYTIGQLPEAKVINSYGGKVDIMPFFEGHSTTDTISRMKGEAA